MKAKILTYPLDCRTEKEEEELNENELNKGGCKLITKFSKREKEKVGCKRDCHLHAV